ncbi:helix-turn-helix domain-containing protein [Sulfitobacter sp.]|uniref:helix-turn-helix domain-containing protein n=1 Tax=Sulfitobacter sp. TaxID=1903071 RepID=UPI00300166D9
MPDLSDFARAGEAQHSSHAVAEARAGKTLSQWRVIALVGAAGRTKLSGLAQETAFDKGLSSRNIKTLIEGGLLQSETDQKDHRVQT